MHFTFLHILRVWWALSLPMACLPLLFFFFFLSFLTTTAHGMVANVSLCAGSNCLVRKCKLCGLLRHFLCCISVWTDYIVNLVWVYTFTREKSLEYVLTCDGVCPETTLCDWRNVEIQLLTDHLSDQMIPANIEDVNRGAAGTRSQMRTSDMWVCVHCGRA